MGPLGGDIYPPGTAITTSEQVVASKRYAYRQSLRESWFSTAAAGKRNSAPATYKKRKTLSVAWPFDFKFEWDVADPAHLRKSLRFNEPFEVWYDQKLALGKSDTFASSIESAPPPPLPPLPAQAPLDDPPPNGGYGWVCVACVAIMNAHTWGINAYGVFLAFFLSSDAYPGATPLEFALIGGLSVSCGMLIAPAATLLTGRLGMRCTLLVGVAIQSGALIGASFADQIWMLFLTQGVAFGVGMGFIFVSSVSVASQWFTTKRSLANGIASSGSGLGGLVYALAAGAMLRTIGVAWCYRVLGLLSLGVNGVCIAFLRDRSKATGARYSPFAVRLFKRPEYLLLNAFGVFSMLGAVALGFSLSDYGRNIGLDSSQGAVISAVFSLGQGVGRPPVGHFSDKIGRINMASATSFFCGLLALFIWTAARSYAYLLFFAFAAGTVAGSFWAVISPITAEVVGLQDLPSALNLEWLVIVLPCTFSVPIAQELIRITGQDYLATQIFVGASYVAAGICVMVLRGWKIGEEDEMERILAEEDKNMDDVKHSPDDIIEMARAAGRRTMWANASTWRKV